MAYEQHVREVAEEMAVKQFTDFAERDLEQQKRYILYFDYAAHIAVRRESEAVRKAINDHFVLLIPAEYKKEADNCNDYIDKYLIERGLIPVPGCNHDNMESIGGRGWKCLQCDKMLIRDKNGFTAPEDTSGPYAMGPGH